MKCRERRKISDDRGGGGGGGGRYLRLLPRQEISREVRNSARVLADEMMSGG